MIEHYWVCKGCLIKAGFDPDKVTESCIARFGKITCHYCGHIQDHTWFKHVSDPEVIEKLDRIQALGRKMSIDFHMRRKVLGAARMAVPPQQLSDEDLDRHLNK